MEGRGFIQRHHDLDVYQKAFRAAMTIFELSKEFPIEEKYSLTDQVRRASRSVCANLAEAWRKRHYEAAWRSKLSDCEAEAAETQIWIQFAVECQYLTREKAANLYGEYEGVIGMLVRMRSKSSDWKL
ncbi:MAG TPA: four helix bundle protein [Blastocatellia bacterium]|nr:four helix bundle protein [Blastocatellia bacterium]